MIDSASISTTSTTSATLYSAPLYQRAMGPAFGRLAPALARFHSLAGAHRLQGQVQVLAPATWPARLLALALGAPQRAAMGRIEFVLDARPEVEVWTRHFPTRTMCSTLRGVKGSTGASGHAAQVEEHLGAARLLFELCEVHGRLVMRLQQLHFCGIACPAWLRPQVVAEETGVGDTLHFDVQATLPGVGRVVGYRGHLVVPHAACGAGGER